MLRALRSARFTRLCSVVPVAVVWGLRQATAESRAYQTRTMGTKAVGRPFGVAAGALRDRIGRMALMGHAGAHTGTHDTNARHVTTHVDLRRPRAYDV